MLGKRHKSEEFVAKMQQINLLVSQGISIADAVRTIDVPELSYYQWLYENGVLNDQIKRIYELEAENARLRRAVSDLTLDKMILAEAVLEKRLH